VFGWFGAPSTESPLGDFGYGQTAITVEPKHALTMHIPLLRRVHEVGMQSVTSDRNMVILQRLSDNCCH